VPDDADRGVPLVPVKSRSRIWWESLSDEVRYAVVVVVCLMVILLRAWSLR
jgi:hypothetical protein